MRFAPILALLLAAQAHAATFTVTSTADSGTGSLRQAIADVNAHAATFEAHAIRFDAAFPQSGTIQLLSALPALTKYMVEIDGNGRGPVLDGRNAVRILQVASSAREVSIRGVTFRNGRALGNGGCLAAQSDAGLTDLYVQDARFEGCTALGNAINASGGAIHWLSPDSVVMIGNTVFEGNIAGVVGTSSLRTMSGGALRLSGRNLQIAQSRFTGNVLERIGGMVQGLGGAIYLQGTGQVIIHATQFDDNAVIDADGGGAASFGGAALLECLDDACGFHIANSSFIDNTMTGQVIGGGGLASVAGDLSLRNVSFSGNGASGWSGGALLKAYGGELDVQHAAFAGNAGSDGAHLALSGVDVVRWAYTILGPTTGGAPCSLVSSTVATLAANVFESACGELSGSDALIGPVGALTLDASVLPVMLVPGSSSPAVDIIGNAHHALPRDARDTFRPQDGDGDGIGRPDAGPIEVWFRRPEIFADGFEARPALH